MASFNRVVLVGNLTRDVEIRYISSGTAVTDISLAVNDRVKKNNEWVDETSFFDVTLWGRTAEVASEYLSKGSSVLIEGRLKQERWEQDGQKRSKVKVIGEKMQMLSRTGGPQNSGQPSTQNGGGYQPQPHSNSTSHAHTGGQPAPQQETAPQGPPPADDIPF